MAVALAIAAAAAYGASEPRHVIVISIDGLKPETYIKPGPSKVPTLRRLAKDDIPFRSVQCPLLPHPSFQGAPDAIIRKGQRVQPLEVTQQGDGLQRTVLLQQGDKVILPIALEGIGDCAPVNDLAVRGQCWIGIEASGRAFAEPRTGRR